MNKTHTITAVLCFGLVLAGCGDDASTGEVPLRILVTNDDGFDAEGINALVEALIADPANDVVVCAPLTNQSGTGDDTNCGSLQASQETTLGGFPRHRC